MMWKFKPHDGDVGLNPNCPWTRTFSAHQSWLIHLCVCVCFVRYHHIMQWAVKRWTVWRALGSVVKFICQGYRRYLTGRNPHLVEVSCGGKKSQLCRRFRQPPCEFVQWVCHSWLVHKTLTSPFVWDDDGWMCFPLVWTYSCCGLLTQAWDANVFGNICCEFTKCDGQFLLLNWLCVNWIC